jgi:RNA polymerase sigma factor (sigma-70 family)
MDRPSTDATPVEPAHGLMRAYHRQPAVEAEIRALPPATDPIRFVAAVLLAAAPETLVYGIRQLLRADPQADTECLFEQLLKKAAPMLTASAHHYFPCSADDRAELVQRVSVQIWREVSEVRAEQEFWEVFFNRMIRLASADAAQAIRRQRVHERPFIEKATANGERWREEDTLAAPSAEGDDDLWSDRWLVAQMIGNLPTRVQIALRLRLQGVPESSQDPQRPTISQLLGVSDRTVRTYLRKGEQQLRTWLAEQADARLIS